MEREDVDELVLRACRCEHPVELSPYMESLLCLTRKTTTKKKLVLNAR